MLFMVTTCCYWLCELLPLSFAVDKRSAASDGYNENNDDDDADDSVGYVVSSWRMHTISYDVVEQSRRLPTY
jgi:hypothetical protein